MIIMSVCFGLKNDEKASTNYCTECTDDAKQKVNYLQSLTLRRCSGWWYKPGIKILGQLGKNYTLHLKCTISKTESIIQVI